MQRAILYLLLATGIRFLLNLKTTELGLMQLLKENQTEWDGQHQNPHR